MMISRVRHLWNFSEQRWASSLPWKGIWEPFPDQPRGAQADGTNNHGITVETQILGRESLSDLGEPTDAPCLCLCPPSAAGKCARMHSAWHTGPWTLNHLCLQMTMPQGEPLHLIVETLEHHCQYPVSQSPYVFQLWTLLFTEFNNRPSEIARKMCIADVL